MAERKCEWFFEPLDDFTNEAIARVMADRCESDASSVQLALADDQGKVHNVWSVDHPTVARFQQSRQRFRFRVFTRQGGHAPIRQWKFGTKPKPRSKVRRGVSP